MMNQPLRRVDPLGRSALLNPERPNLPWAPMSSSGSAWPIGGGSERAIVDIITLKKAYEQAKQYQEGGPFIVFTYPGN